MALVTEDGSAKADAESYATVAAADTRLAAQGLTNWATLTTTEREQALRRATNYMTQAYRTRWSGLRTTATQALDWPRYDVCVDRWAIASNVVPPEVVGACIDLAFKAAAGDLAEDLTRGVVREKVGPLETEYDPNSPQSVRYRSIDMALAPFLTRAGASATLVRA